MPNTLPRFYPSNSSSSVFAIRQLREPADTGRKKAHTAKWDRCTRKVKAKSGSQYNPYAVCTDSIKYEEAFLKKSRDRARKK
jgi:hypothetical protein